MRKGKPKLEQVEFPLLEKYGHSSLDLPPKAKPKVKSPPAPVHTKNTVIVCKHGTNIKERCIRCQKTRRRGCITLLVALMVIFLLYGMTVPGNQEMMCRRTSDAYVPIMCR